MFKIEVTKISLTNIFKKLKRWWNCTDEIETARIEINRLIDVLRFIGKQHPDIILLLDESQKDNQFETMSDIVFISGNDIYIDNIRVEFENEDNDKLLLVSGVENLTIINSQFYTKKKDIIKSCGNCIYTSSSIDHFNEYICDSCIRQKVEKYDNYKSKE